MMRIDAFVLPPRNPATAAIRVERRSLCERAIFALRRGGVDRIVVSSECRMGVAMLRRLARAGITLLTRDSARSWAMDGRRLVVVSADVVFEPAAVGALMDTLDSHKVAAVTAAGASPGTFAALMPEAAERVRRTRSDCDILERLDPVPATALSGPFCQAVTGQSDARAIERGVAKRAGPLRHVITRLRQLVVR